MTTCTNDTCELTTWRPKTVTPMDEARKAMFDLQNHWMNVSYGMQDRFDDYCRCLDAAMQDYETGHYLSCLAWCEVGHRKLK